MLTANMAGRAPSRGDCLVGTGLPSRPLCLLRLLVQDRSSSRERVANFNRPINVLAARERIEPP